MTFVNILTRFVVFGANCSILCLSLVPPEFRHSTPFIQRVKVGANATFDCSAIGAPKPNITWYPVWSPWPEGRVFTSKDGVRTIVDTRMSDYGRYRCVVESAAGTVSRDFMLFLIGECLLSSRLKLIN